MVPEKDEMIRKRVLYIGSAVPIDTAEGLDGVQRPLSERYLAHGDSNMKGILSHLSIVPSGITLQSISDPSHVLFFPMSSLTLCAAVRCAQSVNAATGERSARFVSLSSPAAGGAVSAKHPAIFTTISRRTEGRKVLECHGFVCSSSKDALELVQCTSFADRRSKGKVNGAVPGPPPTTGSGFNLEPSGGTPRGGGGGHAAPLSTFRSSGLSSSGVAGTSSVGGGEEGDHPVRLVAGEKPALDTSEQKAQSQSQRVAPEFYEPPPEHGYFYKTKDSQIKTYTVERVTEGEAERQRAFPANTPTLTRGPPGPPGERRSMLGGPPPGAGILPPPPGRPLIPVRAVQPLIRPRFFSPPPPLLRSRPMPVPPGHVMARDPYAFLPPPPSDTAPYASRRRPPRRGGSDTSSGSGSSSSSSSPGSRREMNGRRVVNGDGGRPRGRSGGRGGDGSSDVSFRPRTPPTDYERGPRASRKDQFDRSRRRHHHRDVGGGGGGGGGGLANYSLPGGGGPPGHPYELYVYPSARYPHPPHPQHLPHPQYPGYPPYVMDRARSVPPHLDRRGKSKDRKKSRKTKKDKKKSSGKRMYGAPSDISTDSVGYASEMGPGGEEYPRMPRDFRRLENQFKHERAFSKSLAEESRGGPADQTGNAYSLNEHMVQRGLGPDTDFSLY